MMSYSTCRTFLFASLSTCMLIGNQVESEDKGATAEPKTLVAGKFFQKALDERKSLSFEQFTLRKAVQQLQANTGICILLDRRVDPNTIVSLTTPYLTSRKIIEALATHVNLHAAFCDSYVLIGPKVSTEKLKTLSAIQRKKLLQQRRKINADVYRKLAEQKRRSWPRLARPGKLFSDEAESIGIEIVNAEVLPHDVWDEAIVPSLRFTDYATLLLIQFDLSFEIDSNSTLKIFPAPNEVGIERQHRVRANEKSAIAERLTTELPGLSVKWRGNSISAFATVETHEKLQQLIDPKRDPVESAAGLNARLFTFTAPAGTQLRTIVESFRQNGVPIRIEGATSRAAAALEQTVEFKFTAVAGSQFFPSVFAKTNAKVTVQEDEVVLSF